MDFAARGLRRSEERPRIPAPAPRVVGDVLDEMLRLDPGREALVGRHGRYSYAELDREVDRGSVLLRELGARRGDGRYLQPRLCKQHGHCCPRVQL